MKLKAAMIALACSATGVACDKKEETPPPAVQPSQPAAAPGAGTPTDAGQAAGQPGAAGQPAGAPGAAPAAPAVPAFDTAGRDKMASDMQAKVEAAEGKLADLKKKSEMPKNKKNKKMKEEVSAWTNKIEAAKASVEAVKEAANQATLDEAKVKAEKDVAELDAGGSTAAKVD